MSSSSFSVIFGLRMAICAMAIVLMLLPSCVTCAHKCASTAKNGAELAAQFEPCEEIQSADTFAEVQVTQTAGPPVLLLHDIAGPRAECLQLGLNLSTEPEKYRVFIPVLFGDFGKGQRTRALTAMRGMRPDWLVWDNNKDQPVLKKLRVLCSQIRARSGGRRVVVIGNCFTGALAAALLGSDDVSAAVLSQPALPYPGRLLFHTPAGKRALGMSPETMQAAARRANTLAKPSLMGFRSRRDGKSPQGRFDHLKDLFGDSFKGYVLCESCEDLPKGFCWLPTNDETEHSVLIPSNYQKAVKKNRCEYQKLVRFLSDVQK